MVSGRHKNVPLQARQPRLSANRAEGENAQANLVVAAWSKKEWKKSRASTVIAMVGAAVAGTGLFLLYNESTEDRFSEGNTVRNVGYGTFFGGAVLTYSFERISKRHFRKSVEKYNMEILRGH